MAQRPHTSCTTPLTPSLHPGAGIGVFWGNKEGARGRGWEGGQHSPDHWHGHSAGNSRSCPLGVAPNLGKLLEHPTGFQQPGKLLSSLNPRISSGTEHQSHQGFILGPCCFFLRRSLVPQRVGGDWRNLPEPWSRGLINQCLNNCRALQTFCSQRPVEGRDEVEDGAREVTQPSPSSPQPQSCSQD